MRNISMLNFGWESGNMLYGGGLMVQGFKRASGTHYVDVKSNSTFWGHAGDTYGFQSAQGFFYGLNASISMIVNVDFDFRYPEEVLC